VLVKSSPTTSVVTVEKVARCLGHGLLELNQTATEIASHYRRESRLIGSKRRILSVPSDHLKAVQRLILERLLDPIPPHEAAFCYPGRGILDAVRRHQGHRYLLHLDLRDFFPSVRTSRVARAFRRLGFDAGATTLLTALTTYKNALPQGAPTSVAVGNLVLDRLDRSLWGVCRKYGLTYTRYVDDLAISGGRRLAGVEAEIRAIVSDCHWELSNKGGLAETGSRPRLLGVLMGETLNVDPTYVADLRVVLAGRVGAGDPLTQAEHRTLAGKIAWVRAVNADDAQDLLSLFGQLRTTPPAVAAAA
jgi:RNA-directed DNA polymerase